MTRLLTHGYEYKPLSAVVYNYNSALPAVYACVYINFRSFGGK